jgi:hypothetical protein
MHANEWTTTDHENRRRHNKTKQYSASCVGQSAPKSCGCCGTNHQDASCHASPSLRCRSPANEVGSAIEYSSVRSTAAVPLPAAAYPSNAAATSCCGRQWLPSCLCTLAMFTLFKACRQLQHMSALVRLAGNPPYRALAARPVRSRPVRSRLCSAAALRYIRQCDTAANRLSSRENQPLPAGRLLF